MNDIDKKLYELFSDKTLSYMIVKDKWSLNDGIIIGHQPHLEDVFRVANEKNWIMMSFLKKIKILREEDAIREINNYILDCDYDATLPILRQSDETKDKLIDLFS